MSNELAYGIEMSRKEYELFIRGSKVKKYKSDKSSLTKQALVEGLLYVVGEDGIKLNQLAASLEIEEEEILNLLDSIKDKYDLDNYGIELVHYGGKYKFISKQDLYPYAQRLFRDYKPDTLSQAALETLAIVAYKQPVTRVEIEELRGVGCEVMLKKLLNRNLIKEAGRSEAPGRPILYEVTEEFMDSFELVSLQELPDLPTLEEEEGDKNLFQ